MNWNIDKTRYAVAAVVGMVVFVLVGYFAYAMEAGADGSLDLAYWLSQPFRFGVLLWAIVGSLVGVGTKFSFSNHP